MSGAAIRPQKSEAGRVILRVAAEVCKIPRRPPLPVEAYEVGLDMQNRWCVRWLEARDGSPVMGCWIEYHAHYLSSGVSSIPLQLVSRVIHGEGEDDGVNVRTTIAYTDAEAFDGDAIRERIEAQLDRHAAAHRVLAAHCGGAE